MNAWYLDMCQCWRSRGLILGLGLESGVFGPVLEATWPASSPGWPWGDIFIAQPQSGLGCVPVFRVSYYIFPMDPMFPEFQALRVACSPVISSIPVCELLNIFLKFTMTFCCDYCQYQQYRSFLMCRLLGSYVPLRSMFPMFYVPNSLQSTFPISWLWIFDRFLSLRWSGQLTVMGPVHRDDWWGLSPYTLLKTFSPVLTSRFCHFSRVPSPQAHPITVEFRLDTDPRHCCISD